MYHFRIFIFYRAESTIKKKNLYNVIHKFRDVRIHDETDAATILLHLLKLHNDDLGYFVLP